MTEQSPETFDIDKYIAEATRPETTVDVYTRGDLYGDIVDLENKIQLERTVANRDDEGLDGGRLAELEDAYEAALRAFTESKLTLRLRSLGIKQESQIRDQYKDCTPQDLAFRLIHASLVSPVIADFDRWEQFLEVLGKGQGEKIAQAYTRLQTGVMRVSPDFLQRRSSPSDSRE